MSGSGGELRVDLDGLHAAAARAGLAPTGAGVALPPLTPCAADVASHTAARRLGLRAAAVLTATAALDAAARAARTQLAADADSYAALDITTAGELGSWASSGAPAWTVWAVAPAPPPVPPPVAAAVPVGGGARPVTGKQAAQLIHGGPGTGGLDRAAAALRGHAQRCEQAAALVRAACAQAQHSWTSPAAAQADTRLGALAERYAGQAATARQVADQIGWHADSFTRVRQAIPAPRVFDDLEARIRAAAAANAHPGTLGRLSAPITALQTQLAAVHHDALSGYAAYQNEAQAAPGEDPVGDGAGTQQDSVSNGASPDGSAEGGLAGTPPDAAAPTAVEDLVPSLLPAVLGAVLGAAGGVVGGLAGATGQLQQVGAQLAGGLAQGASATLTPAAVKVDDAPGSPPGGGGVDPVEPDLSGPQPGDTEPASAPGALSAPLAPAAVAAPASAPMAVLSAGVSPAASGTVPAGPAMMPPVVPMGGRGAGSAEQDPRLYGPRRLRVEPPPNTEPVKGRREARRGRTGETGQSG